MNYQLFDFHCYDYQLWDDPKLGLVRGPDPRPLRPGGYITCIGAAATFGRFCDLSYPEILGGLVDRQILNFGVSAAGPQYFLENRAIIDMANQGDKVILEVLSARSSSNSKFKSIGGKNIFKHVETGKEYHERDVYPPLYETGQIDEAAALIDESRATWVAQMKELIALFEKPVYLLWHSKRDADYKENRANYGGHISKYPQMVNQDMLDQLTGSVEAVIYATKVGDLDTEFRSRYTGEPEICRVGQVERKSWGYYPSQDMVYDTACKVDDAIAPVQTSKPKPALEALLNAHGQDDARRLLNNFRALISRVSIDLTGHPASVIKTPRENDPRGAAMSVVQQYSIGEQLGADQDRILIATCPTRAMAAYATQEIAPKAKQRLRTILNRHMNPKYTYSHTSGQSPLVLQDNLFADAFA
jgi:hypothetical protein